MDEIKKVSRVKTRDLSFEDIYSNKKLKRRHRRRYIKMLEAMLGLSHKSQLPKTPPSTWGFYGTDAWRTLRYQILKKHGYRCMACGVSKGTMHVDHIKPRSKFPELSLEESNLQVLCEPCNMGKGTRDQTDWRRPPGSIDFS